MCQGVLNSNHLQEQRKSYEHQLYQILMFSSQSKIFELGSIFVPHFSLYAHSFFKKRFCLHLHIYYPPYLSKKKYIILKFLAIHTSRLSYTNIYRTQDMIKQLNNQIHTQCSKVYACIVQSMKSFNEQMLKPMRGIIAKNTR